MQYWRYVLLIVSFVLLQSCASPKMSQELQQGKMTFSAGNYKQAFHQLLPIAVCGNPEAQYAVGYMYYYGYGVSEDTESGLFWINKSAAQHYLPAIKALNLINQKTVQKKENEMEPPPCKVLHPASVISPEKNDQDEILKSVIRQTKEEPVRMTPFPHRQPLLTHTNVDSAPWVIRLGCFNNKDNAKRLVDKLHVAGYKAFLHKVTMASGVVRTTVYVGPIYKETRAKKISLELEQKIHLQGVVLKYKPNELSTN